MDRNERREQGAHYTNETNILKVIEPLFLDALRDEFERLKARRDNRRRAELERFRDRLGQMKFFDPACGCGNFLIIAYRELRLLEIEVVRELIDYQRDAHGQFMGLLDASDLSRINVDQFYGIEIGEFPARIPHLTLDDLYDPDSMPPVLRRAHEALDRAVDRLYRRSGFRFERERVEHLFQLFEKEAAPLDATLAKRPRRRRQAAAE